VTLVRECGDPGCSILTLGELCIEHEQRTAPTRRGSPAAILRARLPEHRYQLLASFASGLTAVVAIRALRHFPPLGH
jgi:hypothetical protein